MVPIDQHGLGMLNFTKESILVCLFSLKSNDSKHAKNIGYYFLYSRHTSQC